MKQPPLELIGSASGLAGVNLATGDTPDILKQSDFLKKNSHIIFRKIFSNHQEDNQKRVDERLFDLFTQLAREVSLVSTENKKWCVIGGDHTTAIGTWSGVYDAIKNKGELGLIWVDAHMDSHTPETSESMRIHGMPLATLLGYGYPNLTSILHAQPKLKPENICLIGVRSFESGEAALLERLNVRVYLIEEVISRGMEAVVNEALARVSKHTAGFGVSIDIDAFDPIEAPGVDVPEPNGLHPQDFYAQLKKMIAHEKYLGTEIVEFNATRDENQKTEKVVLDLINILSGDA